MSSGCKNSLVSVTWSRWLRDISCLRRNILGWLSPTAPVRWGVWQWAFKELHHLIPGPTIKVSWDSFWSPQKEFCYMKRILKQKNPAQRLPWSFLISESCSTLKIITAFRVSCWISSPFRRGTAMEGAIKASWEEEQRGLCVWDGFQVGWLS